MAEWMERRCAVDGCAWWTRQASVEWLDYFEAEHQKHFHRTEQGEQSNG